MKIVVLLWLQSLQVVVGTLHLRRIFRFYCRRRECGLLRHLASPTLERCYDFCGWCRCYDYCGWCRCCGWGVDGVVAAAGVTVADLHFVTTASLVASPSYRRLQGPSMPTHCDGDGVRIINRWQKGDIVWWSCSKLCRRQKRMYQNLRRNRVPKQ
jgi:hypothetical protein